MCPLCRWPGPPGCRTIRPSSRLNSLRLLQLPRFAGCWSSLRSTAIRDRKHPGKMSPRCHRHSAVSCLLTRLSAKGQKLPNSLMTRPFATALSELFIAIFNDRPCYCAAWISVTLKESSETRGRAPGDDATVMSGYN